MYLCRIKKYIQRDNQKVKKMKKVFLTIGLVTITIFAQAQDIVTLTWKGSNNKVLLLYVTPNKQITVYWGDNSNNIYTGGSVNGSTLISHTYADTNDYNVSIIGNSWDCKFERIDFEISQMSILDVSRAIGLTTLYCRDNQLTTLDVSKNTSLTYLDCSGNELTSIDLNTALVGLNCSSNKLSSLDLSKNMGLDGLNCSSNQLNSLNLNNNAALWDLECQNNLLTNLNLNNVTALQNLYCSNNQLDTLDLSQNTALQYVECDHNNLSSLIISPSVTLQRLYCDHNQFLLSDLNVLTQRVQFQSGYSNKRMGQQQLSARQVVVGDTIDFSSQARFGYNGNTPTLFTATKNGIPAVLNVDYEVNNGLIVFKNADTYMLTMTNTAITSDPNYPAVVKVEFTVRAKHTDASLANLTVSRGVLKPNFHCDTLNYSVEVPYSVTFFNITATPNDSLATINGDTGLQVLYIGKNIFTITVTAEDQTITQNYTITVNRKDTDTVVNVMEITEKISGITIYPNPTTGKLIIAPLSPPERGKQAPSNSPSGGEQPTIEIYDVVGQKVNYQLSTVNYPLMIDISHLANGLYFLKVGGKVFKVVKE